MQDVNKPLVTPQRPPAPALVTIDGEPIRLDCPNCGNETTNKGECINPDCQRSPDYRDLSEQALVPDTNNEPTTDYILQARGCWIVAGEISVHILQDDMGVVVTLHPKGDEERTTLDNAVASFDDALDATEEDVDDDTERDDDDNEEDEAMRDEQDGIPCERCIPELPFYRCSQTHRCHFFDDVAATIHAPDGTQIGTMTAEQLADSGQPEDPDDELPCPPTEAEIKAAMHEYDDPEPLQIYDAHGNHLGDLDEEDNPADDASNQALDEAHELIAAYESWLSPHEKENIKAGIARRKQNIAIQHAAQEAKHG